MNTPVNRKLRIFSFDPSLRAKLETHSINTIIIDVPWEDDLIEGPIGEYVEVIDYDPASKAFYKAVNLNDPNILAQNGLEPSEANPMFHQQMVYAVAMTTIRHFEAALGRVVFWSDRVDYINGEYCSQFVRRLRIYPHALRDKNAYYSPSKKALLFGYFPVTKKDANNTPGTLVYTCLSHDIVAHEVAHALLDGVHPRFNEPTNPDVFAFHEAFSDIVALFQHFSFQDVLRHEIKKTRGNLNSETLLSQLAQQFGKATGRGNALRDALGTLDDETNEWQPVVPNPNALEETFEAHDRGAILVSAVFKAFLLIYRNQTADLFRIATNGTGQLPEGDIHPDLANRLTYEAAKCATRVLRMCIRAIDYCPPVDITFGDYLRAIITADMEYAPEDSRGYRVVFVESFREWGIYPRGVNNLGMDALVWPSGSDIHEELNLKKDTLGMKLNVKNYLLGLKDIAKDIKNDNDFVLPWEWELDSDRHEIWQSLNNWKKRLWRWLYDGDSYGKDYAQIFGLVIDDQSAKSTVYRSNNRPSVEIHSVRPAIRRTLNGQIKKDLVIEITQRRRGYFCSAQQSKMDKHKSPNRKYAFSGANKPDFIYRSGCTVLLDTSTQEMRRVIRTKDDINDQDRLDEIRQYLLGKNKGSGNSFDAGMQTSMKFGSQEFNEPFALLHKTKN